MTMTPPPQYSRASSSSSISVNSIPPPHYSPPEESPSYAAEPSDGEQRLEYVARLRALTRPHDVITRKVKKITVTIHEQEPGVETPVFSRNAIIQGEIQIDEENVLSVSIKLEGKQVLLIAEGGGTTKTIFSETCHLWKKGAGGPTCPSILPFEIPFPLTYKNGSDTHPVPPSFNAEFPGIPGLVGRNSYMLSVVVTKPRFSSWKSRKVVNIPVKYHPRSRPYMPIAPSLHPFFSTVKSLPGEWAQITSTMGSRDPLVQSVECNLFVPSVQIYSITDTIPIHLHLRAPPSSLQAFLQPQVQVSRVRSPAARSTRTSISTTRSLLTNPSTLLSSLPAPKSNAQGPAPTVRVFLLRQITAKVHGQKAWRNCVLGEAKMWALQQSSEDEEMNALDWEGEVKCGGDVSVGGFHAGDLHVKDFIVLHLCPPSPETSPLMEHQHAHPIRLVTDPYEEVFDHPSND